MPAVVLSFVLPAGARAGLGFGLGQLSPGSVHPPCNFPSFKVRFGSGRWGHARVILGLTDRAAGLTDFVGLKPFRLNQLRKSGFLHMNPPPRMTSVSKLQVKIRVTWLPLSHYSCAFMALQERSMVWGRFWPPWARWLTVHRYNPSFQGHFGN